MVAFKATVRAQSGMGAACLAVIHTAASLCSRADTAYNTLLRLSLPQKVWSLVEPVCVASSVHKDIEDIPLLAVSQGEGLYAILGGFVWHVLLRAKPSSKPHHGLWSHRLPDCVWGKSSS